MDAFADWCGFLGAWLILAGSIYQAALELKAEQVEDDRIREVMGNITPPAPVSRWWWLLPPVRLILGRRRRHLFREDALDRLSDEDLFALTSFINKATGWMFVGGGAFLIAVKESYELVEQYEWSSIVLWLLVILMSALAVAQTVGRIFRAARTERRRAARVAGEAVSSS